MEWNILLENITDKEYQKKKKLVYMETIRNNATPTLCSFYVLYKTIAQRHQLR